MRKREREREGERESGWSCENEMREGGGWGKWMDRDEEKAGRKK